MRGAAATSFFLGALWIAAAIGAGIMTDATIEEQGPEADAVRSAVLTLVWTVGSVFALGYIAAGVGLSLEQPWGKGAAWLMMPWTLLLVPLGTGIGIYQMVVLPRHP